MPTRSVLVGRAIFLAAGLASFVFDAWSVCPVPQPRLACAEYANSQAVIIAKLTGIREVTHDNDIGGHLYSLAARSILRGRMDPAFQVWEENSSGRATFDWIRGVDYLLFLSYSKLNGTWVIDGCGNSGPVIRSASVLSAIKAVKANAGDAAVEGLVSTDSWTTGVPDVTVRAIGNGTTIAVKTDQAGRFQMRLPAGRYKLAAVRTGWSFEPGLLSYENPTDLRITAGGCAQVHFSGH